MLSASLSEMSGCYDVVYLTEHTILQVHLTYINTGINDIEYFHVVLSSLINIRGGFCPRGFCPRGFCPRGFCPRGVLSVYPEIDNLCRCLHLVCCLTLSYSPIWNKNVPQEILFFTRNQ